MKQCITILLFSIMWLLTLPLPVQAITSAALNGTLTFNPQSKGLVNNCRVYHAFDLPYVTQTNIGATFPGEAITAPISTMLDAIKNKGYTHIQISPPALNSPSIQMMPPPIDRKDTDAQQAQVFQKSTTNPAQAVIPPYSYNGWEFGYQPLICVLDNNGDYLAELNTAFTNAGKTPPSSVAAYGVTINRKVVGFRLGSDRYGSMADLVTLINTAKSKGLGIIADVVFNQTSGYMTDDPITGTGEFRPFTYVAATGTVGQAGYTPATYTWDRTVDLQFFFNRYNSNTAQYAPTSWAYGPHLDSTNANVQQMMVGYLKLLNDIGISGVRFDYLYGVGAAGTTAICKQANAAGLFQSSTPVSFGYGENDQPFSALASYGAVVPVEDHPLHYSLANCFVGGQPMSSLVMPAGIGNMTTATFSVNHDQYPFVAGDPGSSAFYGISKNPNDPTDAILSQLAAAYICAKRDGNPLILRFEDERDTATIIQRGLAFRVLMEQNNAPHEYMVALTNDVLLIARQYGFAVINRGSSPYTITQSAISGVPSAYIPNSSPNNTYKEVLGLTNPTTGNFGTTTYTLSSSGFDTAPVIPFRNAKFFALQNASSQSAYDVTFQASCNVANPGDQVFVVGNHPLLGNLLSNWTPRPDLLNGLLCQQSYPTATNSGSIYPTWKSLPLRFPQNVSLKYKFVIANGGKITRWESGSDRTYQVSSSGPSAATPSW